IQGISGTSINSTHEADKATNDDLLQKLERQGIELKVMTEDNKIKKEQKFAEVKQDHSFTIRENEYLKLKQGDIVRIVEEVKEGMYTAFQEYVLFVSKDQFELIFDRLGEYDQKEINNNNNKINIKNKQILISPSRATELKQNEDASILEDILVDPFRNVRVKKGTETNINNSLVAQSPRTSSSRSNRLSPNNTYSPVQLQLRPSSANSAFRPQIRQQQINIQQIQCLEKFGLGVQSLLREKSLLNINNH
ncbi:MAG: hypothetical protein EZS28_040152, partial [Streblomastix strix]